VLPAASNEFSQRRVPNFAWRGFEHGSSSHLSLSQQLQEPPHHFPLSPHPDDFPGHSVHMGFVSPLHDHFLGDDDYRFRPEWARGNSVNERTSRFVITKNTASLPLVLKLS
jgi:hypothetical protein